MSSSQLFEGKPVQQDYLDYLIDDCNRKRKQTEFIKYPEETLTGITFLTPLKDFTGYLRGYYEMLLWKKYLKIIRDADDRIIQTESYRKL